MVDVCLLMLVPFMFRAWFRSGSFGKNGESLKGWQGGVGENAKEKQLVS